MRRSKRRLDVVQLSFRWRVSEGGTFDVLDGRKGGGPTGTGNKKLGGQARSDREQALPTGCSGVAAPPWSNLCEQANQNQPLLPASSSSAGSDLIGNLVETVRGQAKQELDVFKRAWQLARWGLTDAIAT